MSRKRRRWRVITRYRRLMGQEGLLAALLKDARERGRTEAAIEIIDGMWQEHRSVLVRFPLNGAGSLLDEQLVAHMAIACRAGRLDASQIPDIQDASNESRTER